METIATKVENGVFPALRWLLFIFVIGFLRWMVYQNRKVVVRGTDPNFELMSADNGSYNAPPPVL